MTDAPPMFDPFIAAGETPTKFDLMSLVQGLGGGAIVTGLLAFFASRGQSKDTVKDKADDRANIIEGKRMDIEATERERLLKIFQEDKMRALESEASIRKEMLQMRRTFGHELRNIQQHLQNMGTFYHELHTAATMLALQHRIMRARLKKNAEKNGESFDEQEFPVVDLAPFDPKSLPKFSAIGEADEAKITGRVEILMPHPDNVKAPATHVDFE